MADTPTRQTIVSAMRAPVRREGAARYLLLTLLSFGASVSLTRLFLDLTGYPQLGSGSLHIAHVLWGGLLLFIAALLPLILANRWVYVAGALLAGSGVGLFIDEVGKFITRSNDYFFPAAAPIIYGFFLVTVLVYVQTRRPGAKDDRSELYRALEGLQEVLDHDLNPAEKGDLVARLKHIADQGSEPETRLLAAELLHFLQSPRLAVRPQTADWLDHILWRLADWERRWITRARARAILAGGLLAIGALAARATAQLLLPFLSTAGVEHALADLVGRGMVSASAGLGWFEARVALEGSVGIALLAGGMALALKRDELGLAIGYVALLLSLTTVDLLVFYFDQFSTILSAGVQFGLLLILLRYRRRYYESEVGIRTFARDSSQENAA
jgi:hypothetical protein